MKRLSIHIKLFQVIQQSIDEILEYPTTIDYEVALCNMSSYKDIEDFNKTFIQSYLEYYTKYMRKQNKYTISKFLIDKLNPEINIPLTDKSATVFVDDIFFQYVGIDIAGDLRKLKYYKTKDLLKKKYETKTHYLYEINLKKVIKDDETVKEFDKTKIWDYFEDVYKKLVKLSKELQKDNKKDFYMFFENQKEFEKYFDDDKRDNFEKYYL